MHHMAPVDPEFVYQHRTDNQRIYLIAEDDQGQIVGCVTGVDHVAAFNDPEGGSSLWTPVHAESGAARRALVQTLATTDLGRTFMDLSVLADNENAINLYQKIGFRRVPVFCVKHKHNPINEDLYLAPEQRPISTPMPGSSPTRRANGVSGSRCWMPYVAISVSPAVAR